MVEAFRRRVSERPDAPALTVADATLTFAALDERTDRLARRLVAAGAGEGRIVTLALPNSVEFVELALATLKAGGTPLPVSHRLPRIERQAIVDLADAALVVGVDPDDHGERRCIRRAEDLPEPTDGSDGQVPVVVSPSWKAATSGGSTGVPKLIITTTPAVLDDDAPPDYLLPRRSTVLIPGPLHHTAPFAMAMLALFHGNHLVVEPRFDATTTLADLGRYHVEFVLLVPTMMHRIWRLPAEARRVDLSALRTVFHMASSCPDWLKEAWIDWLGPDRIFELYGASDSPANTVITGRAWLSHRGSVGRAALGEVRVTDEAGRPLPAGEVGEIWMRPPAGRPSRARVVGGDARTRHGWTSVGDLGWLDDDGYLYIADRRTDLIVTGGENVYPAEVEAALERHPGVRSAVVVGLPDEDLGQRVHAVVEVDPGVGEAGLRRHLADHLVPYKTPRGYDLVDEPLRDAAGKVRKRDVVARISERETLVRELEAARAGAELVTPPSRRRETFSLADGFAVGRRLAERRAAAGTRQAGQKISLTYRPVWDRVGVTHPLWAPVYAEGVVLTGEFDLKPLAMPRLEIEVLFRLRAGLDPGSDLAAVTAAVEEVALAFEIVDCHYPEWVCTPADIIADHGFHAGLVFDRSVPATAAEVVALRDVSVALSCDDDPVAEGSGHDVLGGPADALVELLATPFAAPLRPGDLVSTGALTRGSHPVAPGQRWVARAAGPVDLGTVEVVFR
jgi:bile acid-coenzyme A ligase